MTSKQTAMWERPREVDATPLETGGAVVTVRLSPDEVELLTPLAPTLTEAIHHALAAVAAVGIVVSRRRP